MFQFLSLLSVVALCCALIVALAWLSITLLIAYLVVAVAGVALASAFAVSPRRVSSR